MLENGNFDHFDHFQEWSQYGPLWTFSTTRYLDPSGGRSQHQVVILPGHPPPGHLVNQCVCLLSIQPINGPWDQPLTCSSSVLLLCEEDIRIELWRQMLRGSGLKIGGTNIKIR